MPTRRNFLKTALSASAAAALSRGMRAEQVPGWTMGRRPIAGPLRRNHANARYFTDDSGCAIFLTGSHTWANFQDSGLAPLARLDYPAYIDMMVRHNHNFMRFWHAEQAAWSPGTPDKVLFEPLQYLRTGPGLALDGQPKFDLTKFNPAYFERMRSRLLYARDRDIYAAVQLFQSFSANKLPLDVYCGRPWRGHPYNPANNIQNFSAELDHTGRIDLDRPQVRQLQAAYITRVIETVHDLDNVLYEVMNEGGNKDWDWWVVDFVHRAEAKLGQRHPVGLTGYDSEPFSSMLQSACEWVSPSITDSKSYKDDPPSWNGDKVVVLDTDHLWGTGGTPHWPWKSFCRGYNTLLMDPWMDGGFEHPCHPAEPPPGDPASLSLGPAKWESIRSAMGNTRALALKMSLNAMAPHDALASSGYCLATPGEEYVAYFPEGYEGWIDLSGGKQRYAVEWMQPIAGTTLTGGTLTGGGRHDVTAPFVGPAVLYLRRVG